MLSCHTSLPKGKNGYSTYCFLFLTLPLLSLLQVNVCIIFYRKTFRNISYMGNSINHDTFLYVRPQCVCVQFEIINFHFLEHKSFMTRAVAHISPCMVRQAQERRLHVQKMSTILRNYCPKCTSYPLFCLYFLFFK